MREITTRKDDNTTVTIKTPWLSIADAHRYLGISRREFEKVVASNVPCKGFGNSRKYHVDELDKYNPATAKTNRTRGKNS